MPMILLANWLRAALFLLLASFTFLAHAQPGGRAYALAVVPYVPESQIKAEWEPLLARVSKETGLYLKLQVAPSFAKFEADFMKGGPDFVYLNPYHAVMAKRAQGYTPLVRDRNAMEGILVVKRDSAVRRVNDLAGQVVGFPAPNAFGASMYPRALLAERYGVRVEPRYLGNHPNVYRQVAAGMVPAGGGIDRTLESEPQAVRDKLRILYRTPSVASHPIVVHPRVAAPDVRAVTNAFLDLRRYEAGRALLKAAHMEEIVRASYEQDYLSLELLNIDRYAVAEAE